LTSAYADCIFSLMNNVFIVLVRNCYLSRNGAPRDFASMSDALAWGYSTKEAFDIAAPSGAIVWAWEMRP
jgi:hypothetical protein